MISIDSHIAQIVANAIEDGWSECQAVIIANKYLLANDLPFITPNQLRSLVLHINPLVSPVEKAKQGSSDPDAPWSKARHNWILHLLVRFGCTPKIPCPPPPYLDESKVTKLSIHNVAWWDEKHRKVQVLLVQGQKTQT